MREKHIPLIPNFRRGTGTQPDIYVSVFIRVSVAEASVSKNSFTFNTVFDEGRR
jgi:hypothetical protein